MRILNTIYHYDCGDALLLYINSKTKKVKILVGEEGVFRSACVLKYTDILKLEGVTNNARF